MYRAHRAVTFAIAQLSCILWCLFYTSRILTVLFVFIHLYPFSLLATIFNKHELN